MASWIDIGSPAVMHLEVKPTWRDRATQTMMWRAREAKSRSDILPRLYNRALN
jgi:hypothetical protein